jgi:hypothetical protein
MLHLGFLIAAMVIFILGCFVSPPKANMTNIGLALLCASILFQAR